MDSPDYITEHQKGKHLIYEDYVKIQVRLQDGWSANRIAVKELHCSPNTVRKIIRQGMTPLYHGKVQRFKAKTAWQIHKENRSRCCRTYKAAEKRAFLSYVESHFCGDDKWSLDACVGYALTHNLFDRSEMLCTKTLYNYVELGLLGIKNIDLPQKLHRRTKAKRIRERKRVLGRSIEERPESVDSREEFGHWEIDEVIGRKSDKDKVLLTMVERKTRNLCVLRLADKSSRSLMEAFQRMEDEFGQAFPKVFRSIIADNGAENSMLVHKSARVCHLHGLFPPFRRRFSATLSGLLATQTVFLNNERGTSKNAVTTFKEVHRNDGLQENSYASKYGVQPTRNGTQ